MLIIPKRHFSEQPTVRIQHFRTWARSFSFPKSRKPLPTNYFSSAKYLMVRTIWLV